MLLAVFISPSFGQVNIICDFRIKVDGLCKTAQQGDEFPLLLCELGEPESYYPNHPRSNEQIPLILDSIVSTFNLSKRAKSSMYIKYVINCKGKLIYADAKYLGKKNFMGSYNDQERLIKAIKKILIAENEIWQPAIVNGHKIDFLMSYWIEIRHGKIKYLSFKL